MRKLLFLLLLLPALCLAYSRPLPLNATLGEMQSYSPQVVKISDKLYQGGAGLRVYSTEGRILMPQSVPQTGPVLFQREYNGYIWKIWLLTDEEAAAIKQRQQAATEAATQQ